MPTIITEKLLPALCWTFIHSLWQGLVLTMLAGGVVLLTRRSAAALRYSFLCTLFFLFIGGVAVSFLLEWNASGGPQDLTRSLTIAGGPHFASSFTRQWIQNARSFLNANTQAIVLTWLIVLVYKSGKMILDMLYLRRLRCFNVLMPEKHWAARVQVLAGELGIRKKVSLVESVLVKVPVVIGHFKPLILIPAGILIRMPPAELEAVLLHELAHIRRHDYLVNFIQCLSELFLFFNPGLLWVSSLLRVERENCCDDMAISRTSKFAFMEALIRCKEYSLEALGYALGLFGKKNLLLQRMTRIVSNSNKTLSSFESAFFILNMMIAVGLFSGMRNADYQPLQPVSVVPSVQGNSSPSSSVTPPGLPIQDNNKGTKRIQKTLRSESRQATNHPLISTSAAIQKKQKPFSQAQSSGAWHNPFQAQRSFSTVENAKRGEDARSQAEQEQVGALRAKVEIDRQQAENDREQAKKDREQAERDREQAARDRLQAQKDREQAYKDREQAIQDRKRAEQDRAQSERDREQVVHDKRQLTYRE